MDDKQQFFNDFLAEMQKAMKSTDIHVSGEDLKTSNRIPDINLTINDTVIIPPIYADLLFIEYQHGIPMKDIAIAEKKMILEKVAEISARDIHNAKPEEVIEKLRATVVNYDKSKDWLKQIPHERVLDLAIYTKIDCGDGYGIKVDDRMLTGLHMTREELFKAAKENVLNGRELITIDEVALDYIYEHGISEDEVQDMVALISLPSYIYDYRNRVESDGATVISSPDTLKQIHEQLNGNFYILPCSVEQVLIVPKSECNTDWKNLEKFIAEMNEREIPLQDQLSTCVYEYDGLALKLAGDNMALEKDGLAERITHHRSR